MKICYYALPRWTFNPAVLTKVTGNGTAIVRNSENSPNDARFEVSDVYFGTNIIDSLVSFFYCGLNPSPSFIYWSTFPHILLAICKIWHRFGKEKVKMENFRWTLFLLIKIMWSMSTQSRAILRSSKNSLHKHFLGLVDLNNNSKFNYYSQVGDLVQISAHVDQVKALQRGYSEWSDAMLPVIYSSI